MKRITFILASVFLTSGVFSQSPDKMSYQAVVRNTGGSLVTNQGIGMKISILQGSSTGTLTYQEIFNPNPQTNVNGLVSIEIGAGIPLTGTFSTIDWAAGPYFLKTETDPTGGTNYTIVGMSQMLSVPYALYAESAGNGFSGNYNDLSNRPDLSIYATKNMGNQKLTNLAGPTDPNDASTKSYVDNLQSQVTALENKLVNIGLFIKDVDGNLYATIKIGTQVWMGENLKTTKYKDGTAIPLVTDNTAWSNLITPGYCWHSNNPANKDTYGGLYNWYTVNSGNLCPAGSHMPTDAEWTTLENYLIANGYNYDGTTTGSKIAKALASTSGWTSSSTTGAVGNTDYPAKRNATGFTALPGGIRGIDGEFYYISSYTHWWSATVGDATNTSWYRLLAYNTIYLFRAFVDRKYGFSVRCIKD